MDERKPPIPLSEIDPRPAPASGSTSAVIDSPAADLTEPDDPVAREQHNHSGRIEACRNDSRRGAAVAVYYRNAQEVSEGFLTALGAMGIATGRTTPPIPRSQPRGAIP